MRCPVLVLVVTTLLAGACTTDDGASDGHADGASGDGSTAAAEPVEREPVRAESEGCEDGAFHWDQPGCEPATMVDLERIIAGGPPPDGIAPIDEPVYERVEHAREWLEPTSPVMVVDVNGDVRAYPLAILTWHEIVNDRIDDVPVVVTYCPLCNSALVFERTIDGPDGDEVLDFSTTGRLYRSNLVMYDRQHRNLWTQFEGEAIVGDRFLGERLERIPAWLFGFEELAELHPDAQVLSRDTGHNRSYGRNPYVGYDEVGNDPFLYDGETDERHLPMTRLVGLADDEHAAAVLQDVLADERTVEVELGARTIVVLWAPGQASALDTAHIDEGRDVGQTAAFVAEIDGEPVELAPTDDAARFVDEVSGSTFDLRGRATDGPLQGAQLDAVPHDDTFWFVWVAFRPDTEVTAS